jgi:murein DD-endopeptidase MepM/ murein hydrolase activator NlpD
MTRLRKILLITAVLVVTFGLALYGNQLMSRPMLAATAASQSDGGDQSTDVAAVPDTAVSAESAPQLTTHVVAAGETLSSIASQFGTDTASLMSINNLSTATIRVGQTMEVLNVKGVVHKVASGDTLWDIAHAYQVALSSIIQANPGLSSAALQMGKDLIIPGGKALPARTATVSRGSSRTSTNTGKTTSTGSSSAKFIWPVATHQINSGFGTRSDGFHEGLDIGASMGTTVKASAAGTVVYAGWATGYGYLVEIDHAGGYQTRYGHNSKLLVQVGQKVAQGQAISISGSTGNSTGPHLHFEIRKNGTAVNPRTLLP